MKASDYVVRFLAAQGVTHTFTLSGGMLGHLLDSFATQEVKEGHGHVRLVSCHHEQGAGFAAEGWARMTGVPGVALGTSGPGATNLLTAIGSCYFDSVPAVFITGSVNRDEMKGAKPIRQLGFQETDIVSMAQPVTKWAARVTESRKIGGHLDLAFKHALSGRRGPVLLDIPLDVQAEEVVEGTFINRLRHVEVPNFGGVVTANEMEYLFTALDRAERPLVLVGGGARCPQLGRTLNDLGIPVVYSLMGVDLPPSRLRVGLIGSYGNRWANAAIAESDFLLVLGSRLDVRQTGTAVEEFGCREIIHVDIDAGELSSCRVPGAHDVRASVAAYCGEILARGPWYMTGAKWEARLRDWHKRIAAFQEAWPDDEEVVAPGINPNDFMRRLGCASQKARAFVVDVGQHQMWAAQSLVLDEGQRFLTSGGMGAMGFALPAAIGACLASTIDGGAAAGHRPVVVIAGDGGFQVNIQELQTVKRLGLPVKMVVINNRSLGMVRQFQDSYFGGRRTATSSDPSDPGGDYSAPSFMRIAEAYGIPSRLIDERWIDDAIEWLWETGGPALLEVSIDPSANAYPKLAWGHGLNDMEPTK